MKRYLKRALPRHRAQGRRTRWRKKRIRLRREWGQASVAREGIEVLTGATLDKLAESIAGIHRHPRETDNDFRNRLNTMFRGPF